MGQEPVHCSRCGSGLSAGGSSGSRGIGLEIFPGLSATCFIASANYVINERLDAEFDQYHPTKKNRPVVAQNMKFGLVMLEYLLFILAGILCAMTINRYFLYIEIWLLIMGVLYSEDTLIIGDRMEKDGEAAKAAGVDYLILKKTKKGRKVQYKEILQQIQEQGWR